LGLLDFWTVFYFWTYKLLQQQHPDQLARPVRAYPQFDKLSTAWKLALPGPTNGLTSRLFEEVMALHLGLPSLACASVLGQPVGTDGQVVGPYGDEVMCAKLPQDTWRWRHDSLKLCLMNLCREAKIPADAEVFGLFRDLVPAELMDQGGELQFGRQRVGLTPDLMLRFQTADGPRDQLGEIKMMSAGVSRYPIGKTEKQADRRARELPSTYRRPLARLDTLYHGTGPGETGPLVSRLQSWGELLGYVAGAWGEGSQDLHALIQAGAESRVAFECRSSGRQETERRLGAKVAEYRRLVSTCCVRAQAQCLVARIGLISPAARVAAQRREVAGRLERQLQQERKAQWMASLAGPGWARRGNCHGL
jgi:hypothetical protein